MTHGEPAEKVGPDRFETVKTKLVQKCLDLLNAAKTCATRFQRFYH